MSNAQIAQLLRNIAAVYEVTGENRFRIIAYQRAADSIEHLTSEAKDIWDEGKLAEIPGVGPALAQHLDELFRTGKVRHFEAVTRKVPGAMFPLLLIPGLGPKKAYKLVTELKLKHSDLVVEDLLKAAKSHKIAQIESFGEKSEQDVVAGIEAFKRGQIKQNRMVLPEADYLASQVLEYLRKSPVALRADPLGSLRRQVSTIGDIDIAVATNKPIAVVDWFIKYPHQKLIEKGPTGASLLLTNGRQVDMRVQKPQAYGAMLQYFTGSKHHNIKLREYALKRGLSLSEYGIKNVRTKKRHESATEEQFYQKLGLKLIPPELREGKGEIEAAQNDTLPKLVKLGEIKGDLHIHTNYNLEPSHDLGVNSLVECLDKAASLGYEYIGLSDHNPSVNQHTHKMIIDIMKQRKDKYEQQYSSWVKKVPKTSLSAGRQVQMFFMCEVDILTDGKLALPDEAYNFVDGVIASVHSSFNQDRKTMTERILRGIIANPKVRILGHPTGRLLMKREGYEADWSEIFRVCQKHDIALEINAYPQRLDLSDSLVYEAVKQGLKFCINTDAHAIDQMDLMRYGVSVARRGWARAHDIVNCLGYNAFAEWLSQRR